MVNGINDEEREVSCAAQWHGCSDLHTDEESAQPTFTSSFFTLNQAAVLSLCCIDDLLDDFGHWTGNAKVESKEALQ